jgi:2-dehydro-3-deoxygluconokinase
MSTEVPPLDILAIGEPMLEFNQRSGDGDPLYLQGFGGDTSNFAVAAARQGARVGMFTRLGEDTFGDQFMNLWASEGVDARSVIRDPEAATGIYFVSHDERGHHFSYYRRDSAASRLKSSELPSAQLQGTRVLHLSGITQAISSSACDTAFEAMAITRAAGGRVSYDPNIRPKLWPTARARAVVLESLKHADLFLPSLEDAQLLLGPLEPDALADAFLAAGASVVALKLGKEGVLVASAEERFNLAGHRVESVDATGAGDTFDGAFVSEWLRGAPLREAARYANAAAALSTRGYGAVAPIPRRADVEAFLTAQSG